MKLDAVCLEGCETTLEMRNKRGVKSKSSWCISGGGTSGEPGSKGVQGVYRKFHRLLLERVIKVKSVFEECKVRNN